MLPHLIGSFEGKKHGPLTIVFGAMHGNEPAGVLAFEFLLKMLEVEPITNPNFSFTGKIIGLRGHTRAIQIGKRFINQDLNRQWKQNHVEKILATKEEQLDEEALEIKEIIGIIRQILEAYQPTQVNIIDIHTTSAQGGIFTIPAEDDRSINIGKQLQVPVVLGLLKGLEGTSLHYFTTKTLGFLTSAVCFEAGQHDDPLSVNRSIAAILFLLKAVGSIKKEEINPLHTKILVDYSKNLPQITHFFYRHSVKIDDDFKMLEGFNNFDKIKKGTLLAKDKNGEISAPQDCRILMPLYQSQGEDGFFLVSE